MCFQCLIYCNGGAKLHEEVIYLHLQLIKHCKIIVFILFFEQSVTVADAVFKSQWFYANIHTQKALGFIMRRSQKPVILKSVFFEANLTTFSSVKQIIARGTFDK